MTRTQIAVSWSGGKDSTLMLERLLASAEIEIVSLVTTVSTVYDRISIHGVRRSILRRQAQSLDLPLLEVQLGESPSNASYQSAFEAGLDELRRRYPGLTTMAFGDLFLEDVRRYRDDLLAGIGWRGLYPLWGEPTPELAEYFVERGYQGFLTCVDTTQLDGRFAGRAFDAQLLAELPSNVDPCGERGEFHTCVYAGPIFREAIELATGERVLRENRFQYCDLVELTAPSATHQR